MPAHPADSHPSTSAAASASPPLVPAAAEAKRAAIGFDTRTLRRITAMAFRHRGRMALALAATVCAASAQILIPQLIGSAVDQAQGLLAGGAAAAPAARAALFDTAVLLLVTASLRGLFTMTQNYQGEAVGQLIGYELRLAYYRQLQHLSFAWHDRVHTGELMTRGILDIEGTRLWVDTGILRMVLLTVLIGGGVTVLGAIDGPLTAVALGFVPVVGAGATVARLKLRTLWYALQEELGVLTRIMEENLGGIRVVRAFAAQAFEMMRFDHVSARALAIAHRRIGIFVTSTTTMAFVFFLGMGLTLWVGGARVVAGHITVGELAAFLAFMTILQQPVRQIAWMVNSIARTSTCGGRLFEILDLEPEIRDAPGAPDLRVREGVVRFEGVGFRYRADGPLVLEGVDLELRPGRVTALVGPPGSGKSTLAQLVARYYDVSAGRITIDGQDIREVRLASLRRHVMVVQQDAFLFTSAIDTNVAYGDPWADRSNIRRATEAAQLHNYIAGLPEDYRTLVGERGVSLSGGQRQRLAIARGVLPVSGVLVLDDATAAVDAGTERELREALAGLTASRAVLVIAHRLSSLMHADEIVFLDGGRIVERGSHAELLATGGRYAQLHTLQTRGGGADA